MSLRRFAEVAGIDFGYVGQIERGERRCSPEWAEICDQTVGAEGELMAAHRAENATGTGAEVRRRTVVMGLALGASSPAVAVEALRHGLDSAIGADLDEWQTITEDYARDFYTTPPARLVEQLGLDLTMLQHMLSADPANRDLLRAAGQLAVIMAMALASTGQTTMARRWWRTARHKADQSGDVDTRLWARDWETVNGTYERRPIHEIIALADEAVALADGRPCRGTAGVLAGRA
ncbi:XRE family transcriptional regulator, partial [Plantactinospora sp. S1510]|nr:XRE family transcriptional regulator [Plantactinospora alkalitolerans]